MLTGVIIRFLLPALFVLVLVAGCSGPVETRVETESASALPEQRLFSFAAEAEQQDKLYDKARNLVAKVLTNKGFSQKADAPMLVYIALSDRPADIAITVGDKKKKVVAQQKQKKLLQSCDDREHRVTITIINREDGREAYTGAAAEYHCKGSFEKSLRHLVDAALADLSSNRSGKRTKLRLGVD